MGGGGHDPHDGFDDWPFDSSNVGHDKWSLLSQGASENPCSEIYRGPRAFSEPETNAVKRFIMDRSRLVKHEANGCT